MHSWHSTPQPAGHPAATRPVAYLPFTTTTTAVILGIDRGVPILRLFSCQCGHCPFLFGGRGGGGGGGGGGGAVGCRVGIVYVHCLGYVLVYIYVLRLDMFMFVLSQLSFRLSQFNFMF